MSDKPQMGLDLGLPEVAPSSVSAKANKPHKESQVDAISHAGMSVSDMADVLSAHADFRVMRRLVPATYFEPAARGPVRRVAVLDTETTGLSAATDVIIELAVVVMVQVLRISVSCSIGHGIQDKVVDVRRGAA